MGSILTVTDVSVMYGGKTVIKDICFDAEDGDFIAIFGENGSGKSTLIKALLGLITPAEGEITYHNSSPMRIGYLPQTDITQKNFPASAWEVVLSGCLNNMRLRPFYGKIEKQSAKKNMQLLSVYDLRNECFCNLSGGQKQRVLLARALCATDRLLMLDEPTSGLDPAATSDFYRAIRKINQSGVCVIMVSHDTHKALCVAKHVLEIGEHKALFFGNVNEYIIKKEGQ